jgi:AmmeMemoRadiSam system protein A
MEDFPAEYSAEERRWLLRLAHLSIRSAVTGTPLQHPEATPHLKEPRGAFTTIHKDGKLRGCIGFIVADKPLDSAIIGTARAAALEDPRFHPVSEDELESLQVEISVLSPMVEIEPEDVVPGRHGLMVSYEKRRGLLLPQVAKEWGWDQETFLEQVCHKAGLPPNIFRSGAKLEAFTAEVFAEKEAGESLRV